jgi:hypothetical protein
MIFKMSFEKMEAIFTNSARIYILAQSLANFPAKHQAVMMLPA